MNKLEVQWRLFFLLFLGVSCKHEALPTVCSTPTLVSFQRDIVPIFNQQCNIPDCHSGSYPKGNLNLETPVAYTQLIQPGKGYIDTLTPRFSVLYTSMNATASPMPPTGKLDPCVVELVLRWIEQKAANN